MRIPAHRHGLEARDTGIMGKDAHATAIPLRTCLRPGGRGARKKFEPISRRQKYYAERYTYILSSARSNLSAAIPSH
jgi:hypothetical protein